MKDRFSEPGITDRHDVVLRKESRGQKGENTVEAGSRRDLDQTELRSLVKEFGLNDPHVVDPLGHEHEQAHEEQQGLVALRIAWQEKKERNAELSDKQEDRDGEPASVEATEEPAGLLG